MDSHERVEALVKDHGNEDWVDIEDGEEVEEKKSHEPHPADELLQTQRADGTESYILGGY